MPRNRRPEHVKLREGAEIRREHRGRGWRPEVIQPTKQNWNQLWPGRNPDLSIRAQNTRLRGWASEEWDRVVKGLEVIGLLSVLDTSVVQMHCSAFALYREAMRRVGEDGMVIEGHKGRTSKHPGLTVANQAYATIKWTSSQLSLTPPARAFGIPANPDEIPSPQFNDDGSNVVGLWD